MIDKHMFKFKINFLIILQRSRMILYFLQQCMRVLVVPYFHQGLVLSITNICLSDEYKLVSYGSFNKFSLISNDIEHLLLHLLAI